MLVRMKFRYISLMLSIQQLSCNIILHEVETISRTGYIRSVATPNRHKSACPTRYASLLLKREPI